jgi:hypothetical protein
VARLSRRSFVLGGSGLVLAACGSGKGSSGTGGTAGTSAVLPADQYQVVQFFKSGTPPAGMPFRLPFGLGSTDGVLQAGGPQQMDVRILDANGREAQPSATVTRHARQLERPYWPVTINLAKGTYQAVFMLGGKAVGSPAFFDVGTVPTLPKPGDKLPVHTTPTAKNTEGVTPICTRSAPRRSPCWWRRRPTARPRSAARCSTCCSTTG